MRIPVHVPAAAAAIALSALVPATASAGAVDVRKAVVYGKATVTKPSRHSARLLVDLYQPAKRSKKARPVVVLIHGGGFKQQSRTDAGMVRTARALAARGTVAASIDYRLAPQGPVPSRRVSRLAAALPKKLPLSAAVVAVDDTLTAVDYLKANAKKLRIDVDRLGLIGASAGAVTADHVGYALDDHGIKGPKVRFVGSLWGGILASAPRRLGPVSANQLERGEPALFAVHGDRDPTVPVILSDQLVARARAQRVRATYYRLSGGLHGFRGTQFFTRKVRGSQTSFDRLLAFAADRLR